MPIGQIQEQVLIMPLRGLYAGSCSELFTLGALSTSTASKAHASDLCQLVEVLGSGTI